MTDPGPCMAPLSRTAIRSVSRSSVRALRGPMLISLRCARWSLPSYPGCVPRNGLAGRPGRISDREPEWSRAFAYRAGISDDPDRRCREPGGDLPNLRRRQRHPPRRAGRDRHRPLVAAATAVLGRPSQPRPSPCPAPSEPARRDAPGGPVRPARWVPPRSAGLARPRPHPGRRDRRRDGERDRRDVPRAGRLHHSTAAIERSA